ncbi:MAG: hypothetical protein GWN93_06735 [Deltaproteobacteria bacterium]|nr:hypothetical protein [Deltaproteobacteria bacterium]
MLKTLSFRIQGTRPLIMHNGLLADPSNKYSRAIKEISGKRGKTEADYEEMARLEFLGGLYMHNGGPCIPGDVLEGALIGKGGAARKQKRGKQAATGLYCMDNYPLEYDGPKAPDELWAAETFRYAKLVRVGQSRVVRTRPIFTDWAATVVVTYNPDFVDADDVRLWMDIAGSEVGLMDWRPKFGLFSVKEL